MIVLVNGLVKINDSMGGIELILITFVNEKNKVIKRAFDRIYRDDFLIIGYVGVCDCYKNSCDCVTVSKIRKSEILKIENIAVLEGETN